jgi:hypothetical protein
VVAIEVRPAESLGQRIVQCFVGPRASSRVLAWASVGRAEPAALVVIVAVVYVVAGAAPVTVVVGVRCVPAVRTVSSFGDFDPGCWPSHSKRRIWRITRAGRLLRRLVLGFLAVGCIFICIVFLGPIYYLLGRRPNSLLLSFVVLPTLMNHERKSKNY